MHSLLATTGALGRAWLTTAGALVALSLGTGAAVGSATPAADATYVACLVPQTGTIYMAGRAGAPAACRAPSHVTLQWNLPGPVGPAGPKGPAGVAGPAGPTGPVG
ncbi:MAG: hypothetical protein U0132_16835, partial [Gemmatimonadaceae bacterium]